MNKVKIGPVGLIEELPGYETQDYSSPHGNGECTNCIFNYLLNCDPFACTPSLRTDGRSVIFVYKGQQQ